MRFATFKSTVSCLTLSLWAVQGSFARLLEPAVASTPENCQASDFELPAALVGAHSGAGLPPFVTTEIFATFVALSDGWTPGLKDTETPIVARLTHLVDTMHWNCAAMYSSTWLDALTKDDPLLRSPVSFNDIAFHDSPPRLLCMVHAWAAVVKDWHPMSYPTLAGVLTAFEYDDVSFDFNAEVDAAFDADSGEPDRARLGEIAAANCYKPKIMGAIVARQLTEYGKRDGYNMYGDMGSNGRPATANHRRYTDTTGYHPVSNEDFPGEERTARTLRKIKRSWKPMLEDNGRGYFTRQEHVTPHIGTTAKRAILSDEDFESRVHQNPRYKYGREARKVAERLAATAGDDMKKAKIEYFDDKIKVIFSVIEAVLPYGPSFEQLLHFVFGLTAAEYDSILVAWKIKVATNFVRPTTWIQDYMSNVKFNTWAGPYNGVQEIDGRDFESYVRVMPHSEYISGSACICKSIEEFTDAWMENTHNDMAGPFTFTSGGSIEVPIATEKTGRKQPFVKGSSKTEPGEAPRSDLTLNARTMTHFRNMCGESRLDGGMHFTKSVPDAYKLCDNIGTLTSVYADELLGGGGWEDSIVSVP